MNVIVHRRHRADCKHKADRYSRKCNCPLHLQWQDPPGNQMRKAAKTSDWATAQQQATDIENGKPPTAASVPAPTPGSISLADAVREFTTMLIDERNLDPKTVVEFQRLLLVRQDSRCRLHYLPLAVYAAQQFHLTALGQVSSALLVAWRKTWDMKVTTDHHGNVWKTAKWNTSWGKVRQFFAWAVRRHYLIVDPTEHESLPPFKVRHVKTNPFTDEEVSRIFDAINRLNWPIEKRRWMRTLILVMRYAGMSSVDATYLRREEVRPNGRGQTEIKYQRKKTSKNPNPPIVTVPIPPVVVDALNTLPVIHPVFFFCKAVKAAATRDVGLAINEVLKAAGIKKCADSRMTSHRFRDTAAKNWLLDERLKIEEVSQMLGHKSLKTTQEHYAPWVEERTNRLAEKMALSWENIKVPDLIENPAREPGTIAGD